MFATPLRTFFMIAQPLVRTPVATWILHNLFIHMMKDNTCAPPPVDSCNGMHLVGGASLEPFVAYFARHILQAIIYNRQ